ncbi:hypothetical protein QWY31_07890 [Cytophagales bacterium LB-30]|uniref:Copper-binding protein MbnP-like domain-containing protein n=1 Tax=Shiella aurantiaca TaxID=3058365 RepID=A0ABT8F4M5_9BACT|nr:MbnP family protein [Shiella aurantiaca]MDN4165418.1 hypothetical protein [Shiella aurantiaca]
MYTLYKRVSPYLVALSMAFFFLSCTNTDNLEPEPNEVGSLSIEFEHLVGGSPFDLDNEYQRANGETFSVSTLNYYVSNIILSKEDGSTFVVPQEKSYFLIRNHTPETCLITLDSIPADTYTGIAFTIGVDSLRSVSDISKRTGVLDPAQNEGMYWTWNSGYIFFMMEGISSEAPEDPTGTRAFRFHIGGFGGYESATLNNLKDINLSIHHGEGAIVRKEKQPKIHLIVDVLKVLDGLEDVSLEENATVMFNPYSSVIAENYTQLFTLDHIHN